MAGLKIRACFGKLKLRLIKRLDASSLTETIVATTIILIVFAMATATLNNILGNSIEKDTAAIEGFLNEYRYTYKHKKPKLPETIEHGDWLIEVQHEKVAKIELVLIEATHKRTHKKITKRIINNEN